VAEIRLENLRKSFGGQDVIRDVTLTVPEGEFCVFVGPSGCGKSTLLRLIAGLETATSGRVLIGSDDVTTREPYDRHLAMVFQSYALYPHMSVRDNIAFALRTAKMPESEIARKVAEAARILRLDDYLDRKPAALSGGQRQRVAIGRAIVREPKAFLFDEPLSNLDAALRADTRVEIAQLHRTLGATMVYVTHDQVEAMTLADRIVVLNEGRIQQIGTPRELYERPDNLFVAQFLGSPRMNLIDLTGEGGARGRLASSPRPGGAGPVPGLSHIGVRPEDCRLVPPAEGIVTGRVRVCEYHGVNLHVIVDVDGVGAVSILAPSGPGIAPQTEVGIRWELAALHLFNGSGQRIRGA
jgi:multiple sugar transport system ATP-binding protein